MVFKTKTKQSARVVIHIGSHKTGSTAIQMFCSRNRAALKKAGVLYPESGTPENYPFGHHRLAWALLPETPVDVVHQEWAALRAEIDASLAKTTVISSEDLWWISDPERLAIASSYLDGLSVEVRAYVRPQWRFVASGYQTAVIHFAETASISEYSSRIPKNYLMPLDNFSEFFDNVCVRPYDDGSAAQADIVLNFMGWIGVHNFPRPKMPKQFPNSTAPESVVRSFFHLNAVANPEDLSAVRQIWEDIKRAAPAPYTFLTPAEAREITEWAQDTNREVALKYGGAEFRELFGPQDWDRMNFVSPLQDRDMLLLGRLKALIRRGNSALEIVDLLRGWSFT